MASWFTTGTHTFDILMDFNKVIEYALDPVTAITKKMHTDYVGKNYKGYFIKELVSIDRVGVAKMRENYVNTFTVDFTFTAKTMVIEPETILYDPVTFKLGNTQENLYGKIPIDDTKGSSIIITYNKMYNKLYTNCIFPTVASAIQHRLHDKDIFVTGEILVPYSEAPLYIHDGSSGPSITRKITKLAFKTPKSQIIFEKLMPAFKLKELSEMPTMNSLDSPKEVVYSLHSPLGPIVEYSKDIKEYKDRARYVNMHDIVLKMQDATNAIIHLSNIYDSDPEEAKKIKVYITILNRMSK